MTPSAAIVRGVNITTPSQRKDTADGRDAVRLRMTPYMARNANNANNAAAMVKTV
jgi:hypothetical protein